MSVDNIWDNSDADLDDQNVNNWSQGRIPTTGDIMVVDGAETDANLTFTMNHDCDGLRFDNAYAGTLDADTFDFAVGASGVDCTGGAAATLDIGGGTWTVNGDWDDADVGTKTFSVKSTVILTGGGNTIASKYLHFRNLTISGTYTLLTASSAQYNLIISGSFDVGEFFFEAWELSDSGGVGVATGTTGHIRVKGSIIEWDNIASTATIQLKQGANSSSTAPGVFGGDLWIWTARDGDTTIIRNDITVYGDLTLESQDVGETLTIDCSTNNPDITLHGDVITTGAGTVAWDKGTGAILFSGGGDQDIDFNGEAVEDIEVDKTAGDIVMTGGVQTDSFTGTSTGTGDFDPNGQTITVDGNCSWAAAFTFEPGETDVMDGSDWQIGGNFTADGQTLPADSGWDLDVTGTAVASGTGVVSWCTAGGTEIDASAGPWTEPDDQNTNWNFGSSVSEISGTCAISVTPTGAMQGAGALSGAAAIGLTPSGSLAGAGALSGSVAIAATPTGAMSGAGALAGSSAVNVTPSGALAGAGELVGSAAVAVTPSGALFGSGTLAGAVAVNVAPTGASTGSGALAGSIAAAIAPSGAMAGSGVLAGSSAISLTLTGSMAEPGVLSGSLEVSLALSGNLTGRGRAFGKLGEYDMGPGNSIKPLTDLDQLSGDPDDIGAEDTSNKGVAGGYAALDEDGNIDPSQLNMTLILADTVL